MCGVAGHHHHDEGSYADAAARRAVIVSALVLGIAAAAEFGASFRGHSAGVLADALHNAGDAVTTLVIVVVILITAVAAAFESVGRLLSSEGYTNPYAALAAAGIAAIANFGVSEYKIRVGRRIRSVALEADGLHSRLDGLVSGGAFAGLALAWAGFAIADSLAGVLIAIAIIYILAGTVGRLVLRMMDAIDPQLIEQITGAAANVTGVLGVHDVRARWVGRELVAVLHIDCPPNATLAQAHNIAQAVEKEVHQRVPAVHLDVHMDPGTGKHSHSP
ncbi:MAG: hypothetical protein AUI15_25185 [Actinobacteria bacterium 13_2_20CM_2_66_6]|nr:MAG: hypothetical protein AUI15_25185 [Actinobacteria bacterium 13_2_20CM_2_66_6]